MNLKIGKMTMPHPDYKSLGLKEREWFAECFFDGDDFAFHDVHLIGIWTPEVAAEEAADSYDHDSVGRAEKFLIRITGAEGQHLIYTCESEWEKTWNLGVVDTAAKGGG